MTEISQPKLDEAIAILKRGGVVVFPTETAYGLAADATNQQSVDRIFVLKGREKEKTLPLIAADRDMVERFAGIPRGFERLVKTHWPGPLTLVLPAMGEVLAEGIVRNGEVAVRVSSHAVAQALSAGLGQPIVSTSANISGSSTCYDAEEVRAQFFDSSHKPDFYLDVGPLDSTVAPSTIVTLDDYGYPEVLREGSVEIDL